MTKFLLAAGAAALAIAMPAAAQKGDKGGQGKGHGAQAVKADRGGGGNAKADRAHGQAIKADRGHQRIKEVREDRGRDRVDMRGPDRVKPVKEVRAEQRGSRDRKDERVRIDRDDDVRIDRRNDDLRIVRERDRDDDVVRLGDRGARGLIDGCPPGLAAKNNGCVPPGQAKKLVGAAVPSVLSNALLPNMYRSWYPDTDDYYYRESGGYLYRIDRDRDLVDALVPLYGDYYPVGQLYPADYNFYNVPVQYSDYYRDNDDWLYRYGDGAIYRVDRQNGMIDSIAALLAGDLGVGMPLPTGYDVYNVPFAYRDRYADSSDAWYRYNDGYIYQVDPQTRLIQAVIEALV